MLSPRKQTSTTEVFNALAVWFAPKHVLFGYHGMQCRLLLAALHYNENSERELRGDSHRMLKYTVTWKKCHGGRATVRTIKSDSTRGIGP